MTMLVFLAITCVCAKKERDVNVKSMDEWCSRTGLLDDWLVGWVIRYPAVDNRIPAADNNDYGIQRCMLMIE